MMISLWNKIEHLGLIIVPIARDLFVFVSQQTAIVFFWGPIPAIQPFFCQSLYFKDSLRQTR